VSLALTLHAGLGKLDGKHRPVISLELDITTELSGQQAHELQTERLGLPKVELLWKTDAVIGHRELEARGRSGPQDDTNLSLPSVREGVLKTVREKLVQDQGQRDHGVKIEGHIRQVEPKSDRWRGLGERLEK